MKVQANKKMRSKEGFTMAELLVVVAIIAILVAVSIPIFISKMEKSRESTDLANMRSAKADIVAGYMADDSKVAADTVYVYDADAGKLLKAAGTGAADLTKIVAYGKGKKFGAYKTEAADKYLFVGIKVLDDEDDVEVKGKWAGASDKPTAIASLDDWKEVYQPKD